MNKINAIVKSMGHVFGRTSVKLSKASPEILVFTGIIGLVGAGVFACRATLKVEDVLHEAKTKLDDIEIAKETVNANYSDDDATRDTAIIYAQAGIGFAKLYAIPLGLGAASIVSILVGHNILKKRNLALIAAYNGVLEGFKTYRERVINKYGEDQDKQFRYGTHKEQTSEKIVDENGKTKTIHKDIDVTDDPNEYSQYARVFDASSREWVNSPEYNLTFLKGKQNEANDLLHSRGHIFLNEVYDMLDFPHTTAGAVVGWVMDEGGDNYVDFGIFDVRKNVVRAFVNGYEQNILLDFNVDGVIYDLI